MHCRRNKGRVSSGRFLKLGCSLFAVCRFDRSFKMGRRLPLIRLLSLLRAWGFFKRGSGCPTSVYKNQYNQPHTQVAPWATTIESPNDIPMGLFPLRGMKNHEGLYPSPDFRIWSSVVTYRHAHARAHLVMLIAGCNIVTGEGKTEWSTAYWLAGMTENIDIYQAHLSPWDTAGEVSGRWGHAS